MALEKPLQSTQSWRAERANSGMIFQVYIKTFPVKSLTQIKGKDHIYLDKFAMGSVCVIRSKISLEIQKIHNNIQPIL